MPSIDQMVDSCFDVDWTKFSGSRVNKNESPVGKCGKTPPCDVLLTGPVCGAGRNEDEEW